MTTLNDLLGGDRFPSRPDVPDFWRLSEISLEMATEINENAGDIAEQERRWRARIETIGDFQAITYMAMQVCFRIHSVETGDDLIRLRRDPIRNRAFISTLQGFIDGFVMGATFEKRGGHQ